MPTRGTYDFMPTSKNLEGYAYLEEEVYKGSVVGELDVLPLDTLAFVFVHLPLEHLLIEVELQLLISCVYTQLLKAVVFEVLKTCHVQDSYTRQNLCPGMTYIGIHLYTW